MILVNMSAVATSITLTSMPVSSFHLGPEKCVGSSDCSPASQTIVMVRPLYCWAALTAVSAAEAAHAGLPNVEARPAAKPIFPKSRLLTIVSSRFMNGTRHSTLPAVRGEEFSSAKATPVILQLAFESRLFQHLPVDHATRHQAFLNVEHRPHVGSAVAREALVGPAQCVGCRDNVVELE